MIKNKKTLIFVAISLMIAGGFLIWYFSSDRQPSFVVGEDPVAPSEDQTETINAFGYPDTFVLVMDQGVRYETWAYYEMERNFVFLDGTFFEEHIISNLDDKNASFPEFRPTQFENQLAFSEVGKILGEPSAKGEINSDVLESAVVYNYVDQVSVGTKGDKVVFVQTFPVFLLEIQ